MKKTITALLLSVLLMLGVGSLVGAEGSPSASVSDASAHRGEEVTLTFTLSEKIFAASGGISLEYDSEALSLIGGEWNTPSAEMKPFDKETGKGAFLTGVDVYQGPDIFRAVFLVLDGARIEDTTVEMSLILRDQNDADVYTASASCTVSVLCAHDFSAELAEERYIASAADCTAPASYYYSCTKCGGIGEEKFAVGEPLGHDFEDEYSFDSSLHYNKCRRTGCTVKQNYGEHSGRAATCVSGAFCTVCENVYTDKNASAHDWIFDMTVEPNADEKADGYDLYVCSHDESHTEKRNTVPYIPNKNGLGVGAVVAVTISSAVLIGLGAFLVIKFVILKKKR